MFSAGEMLGPSSLPWPPNTLGRRLLNRYATCISHNEVYCPGYPGVSLLSGVPWGQSTVQGALGSVYCPGYPGVSPLSRVPWGQSTVRGTLGPVSQCTVLICMIIYSLFAECKR